MSVKRNIVNGYAMSAESQFKETGSIAKTVGLISWMMRIRWIVRKMKRKTRGKIVKTCRILAIRDSVLEIPTAVAALDLRGLREILRKNLQKPLYQDPPS